MAFDFDIVNGDLTVTEVDKVPSLNYPRYGHSSI